MSIIALGVSLYVHYIAFSKVAANSRAPQAPHYKLATTRSLQTHHKVTTNSSLQFRFTATLQWLTTDSSLQFAQYRLFTTISLPSHLALARYNPVTTNSSLQFRFTA